MLFTAVLTLRWSCFFFSFEYTCKVQFLITTDSVKHVSVVIVSSDLILPYTDVCTALYRRISNWASPRTSALKPRLSVSSHNTDARQTIERLTLSSYSACVNTENLVIKPGSAQIDVNFVNLKFVYTQCFQSVCGKKPSQATRAGFEPTTSCLLGHILSVSDNDRFCEVCF